MIVGRRADSTEAEDRRRGKAAPQRLGQPGRVVAQVLGPGKAQPRLAGCNQEGKMLVFALTNEDFIPDDESAEQSGCLLAPALQVFEAPDVLAVDEDLRHGAAPVMAPTTRERSL